VAGRLDDRQPADLVAIGQRARNRVTRAGHQVEERDHRRSRSSHQAALVAGLGRGAVALAAVERDAELPADPPAAPLVIGVGVREDVRGELSSLEEARQSAAAETPTRIDEDAPDEVGVHPIRRDQRQAHDRFGDGDRSHPVLPSGDPTIEAALPAFGFGPIQVVVLERVRRGHAGLAAGRSRCTV
jgi:hypothetical protein